MLKSGKPYANKCTHIDFMCKPLALLCYIYFRLHNILTEFCMHTQTHIQNSRENYVICKVLSLGEQSFVCFFFHSIFDAYKFCGSHRHGCALQNEQCHIKFSDSSFFFYRHNYFFLVYFKQDNIFQYNKSQNNMISI